MKKSLIAIVLILGWATWAAAQQDSLQRVSPEYPIKAHIVAVKMETGVTTVGGSGGDYNMWGSTLHVPDTRRNESYEWHLMQAVIGNTMYGLSSPAGRHNTWLDLGYYAFKKVNNGFEVQYRDDKGKVRKELLTIRSEEPAPPPPAESSQPDPK